MNMDWRATLRRPVLRTGPLPPPAPRWPLALGVILAVWLSYVLYAGSLGLPYLQEDSTHILWLASRSPLDPFLSAEGAPAYRPLGKSLIKIWFLILGRHDIAWLRFHNIAFNVLNIALVGLLGSWLDRRRTRYASGGLAALFFAALPFAYQAIPWINNFFYPLENLLLLGMTAVYWRARERHSNRLLALALFLCFLAPFEIEYGAMAGGILLAVELILWRQGRQPYPWLGGVLFGVAVNSLYVLRWITVPKQAYGFGPPTLNRMFLITTYFLQGLLYPVAPLARPLMNATGLNDVTAIWLVCLPALAALVATLWRRRQPWTLLLGGVWFGLLNMPALVFVNFDYVVNGPRLLYPPGVGLAWLWGAAVAALALDRPARAWRPALAGLFLLAALGPSVWFVRDRVFHYRLAEQPVRQLTAVAQATPDDDPLLVVNFPSWITPPRDIFAMGHHGAAILPFYIGLDALVAAQAGEPQAVRAVQFDNVRRPQPYFYGLLGETVDYSRLQVALAGSGDVYLTEWGPRRLTLLAAGRANGVPAPRPAAVFGQAAAVSLQESAVTPDEVALTLVWQVGTAADRDLTVFVHLIGPDGALMAQADGYPLRGLSPFWLWPAGHTLRDRRDLPWPASAPPGVYRVAVGVYDPATGARLPAVDAAGARLPDDAAMLLTVEK